MLALEAGSRAFVDPRVPRIGANARRQALGLPKAECGKTHYDLHRICVSQNLTTEKAAEPTEVKVVSSIHLLLSRQEAVIIAKKAPYGSFC